MVRLAAGMTCQINSNHDQQQEEQQQLLLEQAMVTMALLDWLGGQ
jgi:hypothetical protein